MAAISSGDRPSLRGPISNVDSAPDVDPRSGLELYAITRDLTLRAQTGGADGVLTEIHDVLVLARAAGARRIIHQLLYIEALCNFHLGRLDECIAVCDRLTIELSDDPVDRGWLSSSASLRAIVHIVAGERTAALAELTDAAIYVHDSPPRGLAYVWAVNGLGVGYLAVRMYELALAQYDQISDESSFGEYSVSAFYRVLNAQLAHMYWGLELVRIGSLEARDHFEQALALEGSARDYLPAKDAKTWNLVLAARIGLCLAFLDQSEAAIDQLTVVIEPLSRQEVDEAIVARIGLVRALSNLTAQTALAQAERALLSISHTTDYALAMGAAWERARLYVDQPGVTATVEYAQLLARTSWQERDRLAASMGTRIAAATSRRQQMRDTERVLFDAGTGLASRVSFLQRLSSEVADGHQSGNTVSVAFLDVREDAFDETLDKVIAILQVDVLARYDTHELAVFAVGLTGQVLAERIRACGPDVLRNLTVGVASLPAPLSMTGLLLHADEALHAAHRQGGLVVNNHASVTPDP